MLEKRRCLLEHFRGFFLLSFCEQIHTNKQSYINYTARKGFVNKLVFICLSRIIPRSHLRGRQQLNSAGTHTSNLTSR